MLRQAGHSVQGYACMCVLLLRFAALKLLAFEQFAAFFVLLGSSRHEVALCLVKEASLAFDDEQVSCLLLALLDTSLYL